MLFDFNTFSGLLLPPFIHGLVYAALLFNRASRARRLSDLLLGLLVLLCAFKVAYWMLGYAGWYDSHDWHTSLMFYFPFSNMFLLGPLLFFYFRSLTDTNFCFNRHHIVHFILPALFLALTMLIFILDYSFHYPFPVEEYNQYGTKGPWSDIIRSTPIEVAGYLSFFYYLFLTLKDHRRYGLYIRQNFSSTESVEFNWIRNMIYASAAGIVIFFLFDVMGQIFPWADGYSFYWYPYFFLGILLYYITISGYHGFDRLHELLHFEPEKDDETVLENPKPAFPLDEKLKSELVRLMDREKPYLEPELTLSDLSKRLNSNPSVISKLVNDGFGQNFNDFVNEYRVREVMQKLKAGEQARQTLLGIALDSGFNSKATFNRSFKKLTGKSPRDWMSDIETT